MENKKGLFELTEEEKLAFVEETRKKLGDTKIHAVIVQKGGAGKTVVSSNVAFTLANLGFKVLLIDTDSQASLTGLLNIIPEEIDEEEDPIFGLYDLYVEKLKYGKLSEENLNLCITRPKYTEKIVKRTKVNGKFAAEMENVEKEFGFDFIPADIMLADVELTLSNQRNGGLYLKAVINEICEKRDYDFVIIDCPPGLGTLSFNAIAASGDGVIVPINLEVMTLRGAKNLIALVKKIQSLLKESLKNNPKLYRHTGILGIVKNQYVARRKLQKSLEEMVSTFFPINIFETTIPNKTVCDTAHSIGKLYSQMDSTAEQAFDSLVEEIILADIERNDWTEDQWEVPAFGNEEYEKALKANGLEENN